MKLALSLLLALTVSASAVETKQASAKIDALIGKNYAPNKVQPNPLTSDETFVRRAYLDITGRIPTAAEARTFITSMEPAKRSDLIDQLLDSDGYVSHQFNYWADVLRINSRMNGQDPSNGAAYIRWVKDSIRKNTPYDKFVTELVTAQGMIDKNGAAGFYLRDRGMPLDHLATTVQVFLGTQMVCAQCHDHPFDEWTQMNYYQLAAFSSPMDVVRTPPGLTKAIFAVNQESREKQAEINRKAKEQSKKKGKKHNDGGKAKGQSRMIANKTKQTTRNLSQIAYNFRNSVIGETKKTLKLPHDYEYDDAKPNQVINPLTPFGDKITVAEGESRIEAYGKWMTSPTNPRFTKTIANRMWKRVMGIGMFEPVDHIRDTTEPTNPELMAYLEKLLIDLDYDLKAYYRVLYNTKTYQREAESADLLTKFHYPGPRLRRMSAEQVWDSLITLIRKDSDSASNPKAPRYSPSTARLAAWDRINKQSPAQLVKRAEELSTFTKTTLAKVDQMRTQVEKAIAKKNQKQAVDLARQLVKFNREATLKFADLTYYDRDSFANRYFQTPFRNTPNTLFRQLVKAFPKARADMPDEREMRVAANTGGMMMDTRKSGKSKRKAISKEEQRKMGKEAFKRIQAEEKALGRLNNYVRASELSSPAPDGHFLRTFGQSDRQLIENANDQASVPQTLALMNGPLFYAIGDPFSVISKETHEAKGNDATIDSIYLSMLARKANDKERSLLRTEFDSHKNRTEAIRGIIWTVLNTQQFLFVE